MVSAIVVCAVLISTTVYALSITKENKIEYQGSETLIAGVTSELTCCLDDYEIEVTETDTEVVGDNEVETEIELDENEVDLLARAIYWECGILGDEAMYLCGCVILNRIESEYFPNDLYSVLYQHSGNKYQYDIVRIGMIDKEVENENAYKIARELLTNGSTIPSDVVFQAQFKQGSYTYKQIGNTYFCGLR